jgi:hypothetical protein
MAHYAWLDENNIVVNVTVGVDETELIDGLDTETFYSQATGYNVKRTSYNNKIRKNYAGIGFTYDEVKDAFIAPEPEGAIGFDETTCRWIVPLRNES